MKPPTQSSSKTSGSSAFVGIRDPACVTAIIVTFNNAQDIGPLINDLRLAADGCAIRVVIVDNESSDDTVEIIRMFTDVVLIESGVNLGYPAGINVGLNAAGDTENFLILNPDLRLMPGALTQLLGAIAGPHVGAVVPLMLEENGTVHPSLCREPSIMRALGDSLLTPRIQPRPSFLSEFERGRSHYLRAHNVDWATGAAIMIPANVVYEVGDWWGDLFIYSEEVDYFRRIRNSGRLIRFEPSAVVMHKGGGSGRSPALAALQCVNRVRYIERYHGRFYSAIFRSVLAIGQGVRCYKFNNRYAFSILLQRKRWIDLPKPPSSNYE